MGREETAGPARRGLIRRPVAAGSFYPAEPGELAATVDALLDAVEAPADEPSPRAIVVPHAGYVYSGAVAAEGYARVRWSGARRVLVLGPAHFVPLRGADVPAASAWSTPLGPVEVDEALRTAAVEAAVAMDDWPHAPEHAIEVQLPFLLRVLEPGWTFLPIAIGASTPGAVVGVLDRLADEADLVVVSTDLSHYRDDATARRLDRVTADAVLALDPDGVVEDAACGRHPLRGFLTHAARRRWTARALRLATSADASGDRSSVVGYGAFAFG